MLVVEQPPASARCQGWPPIRCNNTTVGAGPSHTTKVGRVMGTGDLQAQWAALSGERWSSCRRLDWPHRPPGSLKMCSSAGEQRVKSQASGHLGDLHGFGSVVRRSFSVSERVKGQGELSAAIYDLVEWSIWNVGKEGSQVLDSFIRNSAAGSHVPLGNLLSKTSLCSTPTSSINHHNQVPKSISS
ncbi:hypothetical protein BJY00DRAFT_142825 [Aspergillus carlsbadensis]|nr:hypothetical protein BJY00DRAFT_142825 [Aspergillus carlsbadensis]